MQVSRHSKPHAQDTQNLMLKVGSSDSSKPSKSQDATPLKAMVRIPGSHSPSNIPQGRKPSSVASHSQNSSFGTSYRSNNTSQNSFSNSPQYPSENHPHTPTNRSKEDFFKTSFPARKSSLRNPRPKPHNPRYGNDKATDSLTSAAEVSIARQISISRRQKQLLIPIVPKTSRQPLKPQVINMQTAPELRQSHHLLMEEA